MNLPRGARPTPHDHRDYSFLKMRGKKLGGVYPTFPDTYSTDKGLWMPDQNEGSNLFTPPVPSMPEGCTNYGGSDLLADEDGKLFNPMDLENITHANANGGTDLRTMLKAVVKLHPDHPAFFNVQPDIQIGGAIDWFDAVRLAIVIGKLENRAVTVGTPWFPEFMSPVKGIIPRLLNWSLSRASWHCWNIKGWETINGHVYLIGKPWIGNRYGDKGFGKFDRATFNRLMSISGTVAYVLDKLMDGEQPQKIDSTIKQWLVSFFQTLFSKV